MYTVTTYLNSTGENFIRFAFPMLVQSSILILVLLAIDVLLRKKARAVFRYCFWMMVLVKLVLPTSLSSPTGLGYWIGVMIPQINHQPAVVVEPLPRLESEMFTVLSDIITPSSPIIDLPEYPQPHSPEVQVTPAYTPMNWQAIVFLVWLMVAVSIMLLLIQRAFFIKGLVAQTRGGDCRLKSLFDQCKEKMGVGKGVILRISPNVTAPSVCGLLRPVVLLPKEFERTLNSRHLKAVLLHELAHIKRKDLWISMFQTLLQIVYFYNPLLWVANRVIRRVREQAVDEVVLVATAEEADDYPQTLLYVFRFLRGRPSLCLSMIGVVESQKSLSGRIRHMLNRPFPKSSKVGLLGLVLILIAASVCLPMGRAEIATGTSEEYSWGEAIQGVQMRLHVDRTRRSEGELPKLNVDMRNTGDNDFKYLTLSNVYWELELDGRWYWSRAKLTGALQPVSFTPDTPQNNLEIPLGEHLIWRSKEGGEQLRFKPGKHTIRIGICILALEGNGHRLETWNPKKRSEVVASNPVEIEILPYDKTDGVDKSRKQALEEAMARLTLDEQGNIAEIYFGDKATDASLALLRGLTHLKRLNLASARITDAALVNLKELTQLEYLSLHETQITDAALVHLRGLTSLRELSLAGTKITDTGLESLRELKRLEILDIHHTGRVNAGVPISDAGLVHLKDITKLRSLNLLGTDVTAEGLKHLTPLPMLESLALSGPRIVDAAVTPLARMKNLKNLELRFTAVTDEGMKWFRNMAQLWHLSLSSQHVTDVGLAHIEALRQLKHLELRGPHFGDASLAYVVKLPQLERLDLKDWGGDRAAGVSGKQRKSAPSRYSATGLASLGQIKTLRVLWLDHISLGEAELEQLSTMKGLNELTLNTPRLNVDETEDLRRKALDVRSALRKALPHTNVHVGGWGFDMPVFDEILPEPVADRAAPVVADVQVVPNVLLNNLNLSIPKDLGKLPNPFFVAISHRIY